MSWMNLNLTGTWPTPVQFAWLCAGLGYLCGSLIFAKIYEKLFTHQNAVDNAPDHNPGTFNSFKYDGFLGGCFTLIGDLAKAALPVWFFLVNNMQDNPWLSGLVIASPIIGHNFPVFYHFKGGKGIAAAFGSTLGIAFAGVSWLPALTLAALFIFFAVIVSIRPHCYLTGIVFILYPMALLAEPLPMMIVCFSLICAAAVLLRLALSDETAGHLEVHFLCRH